MPFNGILASSSVVVNENATKISAQSSNFDDLDINDVLEIILDLLNYIRKQKGSFAGFRPASEGVGARTGGRGKHTTSILGFLVLPSLPAKKFASLFFKKSSGLYLYSRTKVSGTAHPLYAAVAAARENSGNSDSVSVWVQVYYSARTYFTRNPNP